MIYLLTMQGMLTGYALMCYIFFVYRCLAPKGAQDTLFLSTDV
jgi:hypothetical protein